jgi:allantoate deiminase
MNLAVDVEPLIGPGSQPLLGARLMARLEAFARHTDEPGRLTRLYLSGAHRRAADELIGWMRKASLSATIDPIGNVIGRYEGREPGAPALLIGSHIDTVRDAGRYDGNLGVLAGLACVEELARQGLRLPFAVEIVAFGDEEGVRFPSTLSGSRALAGTFDHAALDRHDRDGTPLREALAAFGCDPARIGEVARRPDQVVAYLELHIEQGPVLEAADTPLGVVTAISGATRLAAEVQGVAGHAGTVPMALRADALTAAAEMVLAVEECARATADLVATVGRIEAEPGAVNVVPGGARFSIDVRSPLDPVRAEAVAGIRAALEAIARRRGVELALSRQHEAAACACDDRVVAPLSASVSRLGLTPLLLPSGAGHDAMALGSLCPIGMLFVRCAGGVSHNPAESITVSDADIAVRALLDFLIHLDPAPLLAASSQGLTR